MKREIKKVLVVNKYHFISGGAERYFFSIMEAMRERGIEPIPLSVNYARTLPNAYQSYFIPPVSAENGHKMRHLKPGLRQQLEMAGRAIYNRPAVTAVERIWKDHRPDLAYFLNFNNHISPSAIDACTRLGIPVVMRMSDFNLVCASNMYYRDGHPCTDCKKGLYHAVLNRCVHGSLARSLASTVATSFHRMAGFYRSVSAFVTPTEFMRKDLIELGFEPARVHHINTFARPLTREEPEKDRPYMLFVGRFVPYKGAEEAIRAFVAMRQNPGVDFHLLGDEGDEESARLKKLARNLGGRRIHFHPFERDKARLMEWYRKALFTVVPSQFYENLPNTILESFASGRPVLATSLGSLQDVIRPGVNGLLYRFQDPVDFSNQMEYLIHHEAEREKMGEQAWKILAEEYSEERHITQLLDLFRHILHQNGKAIPNRSHRPSFSEVSSGIS